MPTLHNPGELERKHIEVRIDLSGSKPMYDIAGVRIAATARARAITETAIDKAPTANDTLRSVVRHVQLIRVSSYSCFCHRERQLRELA